MRSIRKLVKKIYPVVFMKRILSNYVSVFKWLNNGRINDTPHYIKQKTIRKYANKYKISCLIETGTYLGDMVNAMKRIFITIYSIELSNDLYQKAKDRFRNDKHINLVQGDSAEKLPIILSHINEPCIFWLDGHYSGDITARAIIDTPIIAELSSIFSHSIKSHIILIDDARCFIGINDYPTIEELKSFVNTKSNGYYIEAIDNDIITIKGKRINE